MRQRSRTEYSFLNIATGLGGYVVNSVIGFICRMIFVRCLATDYLGINGLFTNILSMLSLAELGVGSAIGYALYKPLAENDEEKIASLMKFYGKAYRIIGVTIAIIGVALLPFLSVIIGEAPDIKESISVIYLLFLFNTSSTYFFSYRSALLQTAQQSYIVTGLSYVQTIVQSIVQIGYLLLTHEYYGYLIIQTLGIFLYNFTVSHVAVKRYPFIAKKEVKPLDKGEKINIAKNVRDLMLYRISGIIVGDTDNIIITYFNGLSATGLTSNYTLFTGMLTALLNQIFNGVNASIGNHNITATDAEKERMFNNINFLNFWLFGWGSVGIICVASGLVELCYGIQYVMDRSIPFVIALNVYMVGMQNAVWTYKNTLGLFRYGRFMQFGTAFFNIVFSIILGRVWGVFGILLASAIARGLTNTWYDPFCVYKYGIQSKFYKYVIRYIKYLLCLIVSVVLTENLIRWVSFGILFRVIFSAAICSLVFNAIVFIVFHKTDEYVFVISKLKLLVLKVCKRKVK